MNGVKAYPEHNNRVGFFYFKYHDCDFSHLLIRESDNFCQIQSKLCTIVTFLTYVQKASLFTIYLIFMIFFLISQCGTHLAKLSVRRRNGAVLCKKQ